jgi:hypothetical protein
VGKTFSPNGKILTSITPGAVGYAQWQVTPNRIDVTPVTQIGKTAKNQLESINSFIYAAGPAVTALTKYGLFSLSYYEEFGRNLPPRADNRCSAWAFNHAGYRPLSPHPG